MDTQEAVQQELPLEVEATKPEEQVEIPGRQDLDDGTIKIDLDAIQERETEEVPVGERAPDSQEVDQGVREQSDEKDGVELSETQPDNAPSEEVLEKIETPTAEPETPQEPEPSVEEEKRTFPEAIDKLLSFMEETGGSLEDYVELNKDISKLEPVAVLREYYRKTKPYLNEEQIQRQLNKKFYYEKDAEADEIEDKKIAFQEEHFKAQEYFKTQRDKYYQELKLGSKLPPEAKEALELHKEHLENKKQQEDLTARFLKQTDKVFTEEFKGFEYNVGNAHYRFNVKDVAKVKDFQSDLNNFVSQFLSEDGSIKDAKGYHKALFTAQNADRIAEHFYNQGRADATKEAAKEANNIDMEPRKDQTAMVTPSGDRVRVVSGESMDKLRVRWNK